MGMLLSANIITDKLTMKQLLSRNGFQLLNMTKIKNLAEDSYQIS